MSLGSTFRFLKPGSWGWAPTDSATVHRRTAAAPRRIQWEATGISFRGPHGNDEAPGSLLGAQNRRDMAEREGFEPSEPRQGFNGFRELPVQPLRHLSASACKSLVRASQ